MFNLIKKYLKKLYLKQVAKKWKIDSPHPLKIDGEIPDIQNQGRLVIGQNVSFRSYRLGQRVRVLTNATLHIGDKCFLNDAVTICSSKNIYIGKHTKIGDQVHIYDTDFHEVTPTSGVRQEPVHIGDNVWIGAKSMVLAGSRIGDNTVIAAGSIVTGEIPANCVAAGAPAKALKFFDVPPGWVRK
jgi:acetyltransferase-like isoleucine patch superfamily enzyme